jgi:hypothetical protein
VYIPVSLPHWQAHNTGLACSFVAFLGFVRVLLRRFRRRLRFKGIRGSGGGRHLVVGVVVMEDVDVLRCRRSDKRSCLGGATRSL